jgi:hypothetical protein
VRRTRRAISVRFLLISVGAILAAEAIVVALLISESYWLECGLLERARRLTPLPVERVVVGVPTIAEEHAAG